MLEAELTFVEIKMAFLIYLDKNEVYLWLPLTQRQKYISQTVEDVGCIFILLQILFIIATTYI